MVCIKYTWGMSVWENNGVYCAYDEHSKEIKCEGSKEKVDRWFDNYLESLSEKLSW